MIKNCIYCGGSHFQAKCPACGKKCNICFKNNRFAKVCKQRKTVRAVNIYESSPISDSDSENEWFVGSIEIKYENKDTVDNDETIPLTWTVLRLKPLILKMLRVIKLYVLMRFKSPDSDSGEMEHPVSDSDEIKNAALIVLRVKSVTLFQT